jgi:hypothetical protein
MDDARTTPEQREQLFIDLSASGLSDVSDDANRKLVELQLRMATSSINHEYARMKFEDSEDREHREGLLEYMNDCRLEYFEARALLSAYDPYSLAEFEADLIRQKQATIPQYHA